MDKIRFDEIKMSALFKFKPIPDSSPIAYNSPEIKLKTQN